MIKPIFILLILFSLTACGDKDVYNYGPSESKQMTCLDYYRGYVLDIRTRQEILNCINR